MNDAPTPDNESKVETAFRLYADAVLSLLRELVDRVEKLERERQSKWN